MSALRSALEELISEDVEDLDVDRLADDLVELELVSGMLEADRTRRVAAFSRKGGPARHGCPSTTAFLRHRCRMATGRARRLVGLANAIMRAGGTLRAWMDTRISSDQARRLLEAAESVPDEYGEAEDVLLDAVDGLSAGDTGKAVEYWRQAVDPRGAAQDEINQQKLRGVALSETIGGMSRLDGWLTTGAGEALKAALDAHMSPPAPDDVRTAQQRRHDALEDLARDYLGHEDTPVVGGERPHINIICDLDALRGVAGGLHETETETVISVQTLRRMACDASVCRIILGPDSEIIDVGRRTRTIPTALRRAVIARDRHCTWDGCERPARWCDVHHKTHWADGGKTNLDDLTLLCRFHHTSTHQRDRPRRGPPVDGSAQTGPRPTHMTDVIVAGR